MNKRLLKADKVSHSTSLDLGRCDNDRIDDAILTVIYELVWADDWFDGLNESEVNKRILDLYNKEGKDILKYIEKKIKKYADKIQKKKIDEMFGGLKKIQYLWGVKQKEIRHENIQYIEKSEQASSPNV